ncbi:PilN domain-containing protein [Erwinia tracheiphila]|nr:PilN domain-containing protein [Erwinia tracheiphila]UIA83259.1 PilN domain-containing protein [Erwinia tracheiphila]UIA91838.1 PilN domain-containing protein [Erwinia tracheiphila]
MVWVNFLPWRDRLLRARLYRWSLAGLILLVVFLIAVLLIAGRGKLNVQLAQVIQRQQEAGQQLDALKDKIKRLARQRASLDQELTLRQQQQQLIASWADFATELAKMLPETVWLSELNKTPQHLTLTGFGLSMADVQSLRQQLLQMPLFSAVRTGKLNRDPRGLIQFSLQVELKPGKGSFSGKETEKNGRSNES